MDSFLDPTAQTSNQTNNSVPVLGESPDLLVGAPESEVIAPSSGLSLANTAYEALALGPTAIARDWVDTRVISPYITDRERPKLTQDKVNELWSAAGITEKPIDANKYNDVSVYRLLERAKNKRNVDEINARTDWSIIGSPIRGLTSLTVGMADPINLASSFFPAAKLAQAVKLAPIARGLTALEGVAGTGENLASRVGARAAVGAAEGIVGNIPVEIASAPMRNELGEDYHAVDSLQNLAFGGVLGGGIHMVVGGISPRRAALLSPEQLKEEQIKAGIYDDETPVAAADQVTDNIVENNHPFDPNPDGIIDTQPPVMLKPMVQALSELNPATREAALRIAVAQSVDGKPIMVDGIVKADPNIGTAGINDIERELAQSKANVGYENLDPLPEHEPIPFNHSIDYKAENIKNLAKIDEIQQLAAAGLYSRGEKPRKLNQPVTHDEQFKIENEHYKKQIDELAKTDPNLWNGKKTQISLGKTSPILRSAGIDDLEMVVTHDVIHKSTIRKHSLTLDDMKNLKDWLHNPRAVITDPENNSFVLLTKALDKKNNDIVSAIHVRPTENGKQLEINKVATVFGPRKPDNYIHNILKDGGKFAYIENKSDHWIHSNRFLDLLATDDKNTSGAHLSGTQHTTQNMGVTQRATFSDPGTSIGDIILDKSDLVKFTQEIDAAKTSKDVLTEAIAKSFGSDTQKLLDAGKIEIVSSVKDLPGGKHPEDVKAMFHKGKVYFVADNMDPALVNRVVLHEVGVHANMREMLGEKTFNNLIEQMNKYLDANEDLRRIVDAAVPKDTQPHLRDEERLAYMIENLSQAPGVKGLIAKVRAWFYKTFPSIGKHMKLTDEDFGQLAIASLRNYASKDFHGRPGEHVNKSTYSRATEVVDETQQEIEAVDQALNTMKTYREDLKALPIFNHIDDIEAFRNLLTSNVDYITPGEATSMYYELSRAYEREVERNNPNPQQVALDYVMDKKEHELISHKVSLVHDQAQAAKLENYLSQWTGYGKDGIDSLLIGTQKYRPGSREYDTSKSVYNTQKYYLGNLTKELNQAGLYDDFVSNSFADDWMRAKELLENDKDTSHLPDEAVKLAKIVTKFYDALLDDQAKNGLIVPKARNYFFNQQFSHNETKIRSAGFGKWSTVGKETFNFDAMATAMNIKVSDINEELLREIHAALSTGIHIGNDGNMSEGIEGMFKGVRNSKVSTKNRVVIFKDAEAAIKYRKEFGDVDAAQAVYGTIHSKAGKIGIQKTLGVNYERTLKYAAKKFEQSAVTPEERKSINNYIDHSMIKQLETIDGRSNRPVSGSAARICADVRGVKSMAALGKATVSALTDPVNAAGYLNRKGMGNGLFMNTLGQLTSTFKTFSPEQKRALESIGVYAENKLQESYRLGTYDTNTSRFIGKWQNKFFALTGLDKWTQSSKQSAVDSLMHYTAGYTDKSWADLHPDTQRNFNMYGIDEEAWSFIRQVDTQQINGRNYLLPEDFHQVRDKVRAHLAKDGTVTDKVLDVAADRYISKLQDKMQNYYLDGLAHMVIEPDAKAKYYATWQGLRPGTWAGESARFIMQFKSFSLGFMDKVLFSHFYDGYDSIWGQGGYMRDWSAQGLSKKLYLAKYVAGLTLMGYGVMVLKDLLSGKQPRQLWDKDDGISFKTLNAAFLQGGGMGLYGDYIFGDFNRFGGSALGSAAGPVLGVTNDVFALWSALRSGQDIGSSASRLVTSNLPFVNMWYTSAAFNYLFAYSLQEHLNPGSLARMERKMEKDNNQEFLYSPSSYAAKW